MPPQAAVESHVVKFAALALLPPLLLELAAVEPLELLHPAASTTVPTAATVATIALFVRKVVPPTPPPGGKRTLSSWLDKCSWLRTTFNGRLLDHGPQPSVLSRFIPRFSIGFNQLSHGSAGQSHQLRQFMLTATWPGGGRGAHEINGAGQAEREGTTPPRTKP